MSDRHECQIPKSKVETMMMINARCYVETGKRAFRRISLYKQPLLYAIRKGSTVSMNDS